MTGYIRKDTTNAIANGEIIDADVFDLEFDGVVAAFNSSSGHSHGGAVGEGAPITVVGPAQDFIVSSTLARPKTTNTLDLGSSSFRFKDLYLSGSIKPSDPAALRTDLGLGTAALVNTGTGSANVPTITQADGRYLLKSNNLSDLVSASTARTNLGLGTAALVNTGTGSTEVPTTAQADSLYVNFVGDQTISGNKTFSGVTALGDGQFTFGVSSSTPYISFASTDTLTYSRDTNAFNFNIGGVARARVATANDTDEAVQTRAFADVRYARLSSGPTFTGNVTAPNFALSSDANNLFSQGRLQLRSGSPTLDLRDTDNLGAAIQVNDNTFFVTRALTDSNTWEQVGGRWPLAINLSNLNATFGANVDALTFTGSGAGLTNVNAASLQSATLSQSGTGSSVAQRTADGYLFATFFNHSHDQTERASDTIFFSSDDNFIRKNTAAGFRTSLGLGTAALVNTGTGSTNVPTVAQADARYAAIANTWPGVYTGSSASNLDYPVGTTVAVLDNVSVDRNQSAAVYLRSGDNRYFSFTVNGTALTGTWRARGVIPDDVTGNFAVLMQRVS